MDSVKPGDCVYVDKWWNDEEDEHHAKFAPHVALVEEVSGGGGGGSGGKKVHLQYFFKPAQTFHKLNARFHEQVSEE